jgi:hypothetical protein
MLMPNGVGPGCAGCAAQDTAPLKQAVRSLPWFSAIVADGASASTGHVDSRTPQPSV